MADKISHSVNYIGVLREEPLEKICSTAALTKTNPKNTPKSIPNRPRTVSNEVSYKFQNARTDKRVSLNCTPLVRNTNTQDYIQRLNYVLGEGRYTLNKGQTIYGFLNSALCKSCGLIFPYTPDIDIQHSVNYDRTDITHSNLSYSHYKNTPPPTINVSATFTADTRENALHMLSAIWFLRAVTKCDFGERAYVDKNRNAIPGMPPPILYLNGYNSIMDNIPVVVTGFSYKLPKDKHYVPLGINLDSPTQAFNDRRLYSDVNGGFNDNFDGNATGAEGMKYLNGIANSIKALQSESTEFENNRYNNYYFHNWLPTEMQFSISLQIQPNLLKYKKKFNLNWYKMGLFNLDDYKGGMTSVYLPTDNGIKDVSGCESDQVLTLGVSHEYVTSYEKAEDAEKIVEGINRLQEMNNYIPDNYSVKVQEVKIDEDKNVYKVVQNWTSEENFLKSDINNSVNKQLGINSSGRSYVFDKSGWTW